MCREFYPRLPVPSAMAGTNSVQASAPSSQPRYAGGRAGRLPMRCLGMETTSPQLNLHTPQPRRSMILFEKKTISKKSNEIGTCLPSRVRVQRHSLPIYAAGSIGIYPLKASAPIKPQLEALGRHYFKAANFTSEPSPSWAPRLGPRRISHFSPCSQRSTSFGTTPWSNRLR